MESSYKALLIFKLGEDSVWLERFLQGAERQFKAKNVELYKEYFDINRFPIAEYKDNYTDYLKGKYNRSLSIVVLFGGLMANLINEMEGFQDHVPKLYFGPESELVAFRNSPLNYQVIAPTIQFLEGFQLIESLHPGKLVYILAEQSYKKTYDNFYKIWKAQKQAAEIRKLEDPPDRICDRLSTIPKDTPVLNLFYSVDETGRSIYAIDAMKRLTTCSTAPIYGLWDVLIGSGIVGGRVQNTEKIGESVADFAIQIIQQQPKEDRVLKIAGQFEFQFDGRQLDRFEIDRRRLPEGSRIFNDEPELWDLYKWWMIGAVALMAALILLVIVLKLILNKQTKELQERNKDLVKAKEISETSLVTKDYFFSIIGHDLRSPFGSLNRLLNEHIINRSDLTDEMFDSIKETVSITHNLVEDVLKWSLSQSGKLEAKPETFDIFQCVSDIASLQMSGQCDKKIGVIVEAEKSLYVRADKAMINSAIRNLVANAYENTPSGGTIRIHAVRCVNDVCVSIEDTGYGLREEEIEAFGSNDTVSQLSFLNENETTSGFGLVLCSELLSINHSRLHCESERNKGSRFWFFLKAND